MDKANKNGNWWITFVIPGCSTTGRIYDSHDAQNKESPGVVEEGLRTEDMDRPMSLDEVRTNLMKLQASTTEIVLRAQNNLRLLGIAELKK